MTVRYCKKRRSIFYCLWEFFCIKFLYCDWSVWSLVSKIYLSFTIFKWWSKRAVLQTAENYCCGVVRVLRHCRLCVVQSVNNKINFQHHENYRRERKIFVTKFKKAICKPICQGIEQIESAEYRGSCRCTFQ